MNPYVNRLLAHIPGGYPLDPQLVPALEIAGTGSLTMTGETLYITLGDMSYNYDLYGTDLNSLASQISSITDVTVLQNGIVELLDMRDGQTSAMLPATLYLPSNGIYFLLGMLARSREGRRRAANAAIAQINLQAAQGRFLDWWGASTGLPRYQGEPDVLYAQRIIGMRFRPTQNNYSIQRLFRTLGYQAVVTDTSPGNFSVQITVPSSPPNGFVYSLDQLADILSQVKSATYKATVTVQAGVTDTVTISDSVNATLNNATWIVGNVIVGQFTV
ncbi:MAG: hypothetical protein K6T83_03250 [Alicyclobacillus sp.]|nr:hypothetical protein [Alicyclobacillus sp.]